MACFHFLQGIWDRAERHRNFSIELGHVQLSLQYMQERCRFASQHPNASVSTAQCRPE